MHLLRPLVNPELFVLTLHQRWQGSRKHSLLRQTTNLPLALLEHSPFFFPLDMCLETDKSRPHLSLPIINSHGSKKSSYKKGQLATYSFASKSKMDEVPLQC